MTDSEKFDIILSGMQGIKDEIQGMKGEIQGVKDEIQGMKGEIQGMKGEIQGIKDEIQCMKGEIQGMKGEIQELNQRTTRIELTLESETNHNIQLLAENHSILIDKLNQSIKVADKTLVYEVQMTSFKSRLDLLEKEMSVIKNKIA